MPVVMVSGRAGEGKTTFANFCRDYLNIMDTPIPTKIVPFAKGVKDTARFMGWDGKKDDRGRRLLQAVGNSGREYDENIWASKAVGEITEFKLDNNSQLSVAFIDDWRFPNEGNVVDDFFPDVIKVRIHRPREYHSLLDSPLYNDISETSLPELHATVYTTTGYVEGSATEKIEQVFDFYDSIIFNLYGLDQFEQEAIAFVESKILPLIGGKDDAR